MMKKQKPFLNNLSILFLITKKSKHLIDSIPKRRMRIKSLQTYRNRINSRIMRKILVTFLLLISFVTYSQTGMGYVNYTSYKTHNGTGVTNQYNAHPSNAAEFDNMLNTANSNTTQTQTTKQTATTTPTST